jgi:hypothetical protein
MWRSNAGVQRAFVANRGEQKGRKVKKLLLTSP